MQVKRSRPGRGVPYCIALEASKGGMKAGRIKDPLYTAKGTLTPPTFTPLLEPFDSRLIDWAFATLAGLPPYSEPVGLNETALNPGLGFRV